MPTKTLLVHGVPRHTRFSVCNRSFIRQRPNAVVASSEMIHGKSATWYRPRANDIEPVGLEYLIKDNDALTRRCESFDDR